MGKRKKPYEKKPFESTGKANDTSANIYMSMLTSSAWRSLTPKQQQLYVYCKAQYYGDKENPNGDNYSFTMNQSKWCGLYKLYEKTNARGFYRDMGALIQAGFIVCVERGATTRTKNIYRYSDMWQKFRSKAFAVSPTEMTFSMQKKQATKKT